MDARPLVGVTLGDPAGVGPEIVVKALLADPKAKWEQPAVTTFRRNNHAVRTEGWRYIRYADGGEELYDHTKDPYEWTNLAKEAKYAAQKKELARVITDAMVSIAQTTADATIVIFEDIPKENWAQAGKLASEAD